MSALYRAEYRLASRDSFRRETDSGRRGDWNARPCSYVARIMRARRLASSMIDRVVFDDDARTLMLSFKETGRRYTYLDVPHGIYEAFVRAPSAGRFFNDRIRDHFTCVSGRTRYPLADA